MPYNNVVGRDDAAALIPQEESRALLRALPDTSAALNLFRRVPVATNQVRFPVLSALPMAYWVTGDTGIKQTTEVAWDRVFLNIEELAAIVPIPEAVLNDAAYPIWGEVQPLLQTAIGRAFDAAVFLGNNAPATFPRGIVPRAVEVGHVATRGTATAARGGIMADFSDLFARVESDGFEVSGLVANRTMRGLLRNARDADGNHLPEADMGSVYGANVSYALRGLWPAGLSAAEAVALDGSEFVVGVRQDITWKLLDQAVITDNTGAIVYNLAQQDMVAMRVVFRAGWAVANGITYENGDGTRRYPAAVLQSPAA